jgi:hypothetical protein
VADLLVKDPALPDLAAGNDPDYPPDRDQPGVHEIYRSWRRILDYYPGHRVFVGEVWVKVRDRFVQYLRPDELYTAFSFDMLTAAWDAAEMVRQYGRLSGGSKPDGGVCRQSAVGEFPTALNLLAGFDPPKYFSGVVPEITGRDGTHITSVAICYRRSNKLG